MICALVVDDQPDVRLAFAFMLDSLGCMVAEAADGHGALQYLATNRVDVVLTNVFLPDMECVRLIATIRKRPPPHPKIIVMSGSENLAYRATPPAAVVVGADTMLAKPITRDKLLKTIHDLVGDPGGQPLRAR